MQDKDKQHVTHLQNVVRIKFHSKSWTAKQCLAGTLQSRGPPKGHLVAFGCPGFVGEFNTYNIMEMSSMSFTTLLKAIPFIRARRWQFTQLGLKEPRLPTSLLNLVAIC